MSLFKKPRRKFRQRETNFNDSDNEDGDNNDDVTGNHRSKKEKPTRGSAASATTTTGGVAANNKSTGLVGGAVGAKNAAASLLSFNDDEDEEGSTEVFKVKKSSVSRRLVKMKNREKKNKIKVKENKEESDSQSLPIIIKHKSIPMKQTSESKNSDEVDYDYESDDNEPSKPDDPVRKALECGAIPDAAMIHAARKQRQQARELGSSNDFILIEEKKDSNESRLIRDDENDLSDEEEHGRIKFSVNKKEIERAKVMEAFLEAQKQDEENSDVEKSVDEEVQRWEAEQIRKGVSIPQLQAEANYQTGEDVGTYEGTVDYRNLLSTSLQSSYKASPNNDRVDVPLFSAPTAPLEHITTEMIKLRLTNRLQSLQEVHRAHLLEMDKLQDDMVESQSLISRLTNSGPAVTTKFNFYQEMRGYITDLVECLNEKVVVINALEERFHSLLADRADHLAKRRQQDCKDQAEEYSMMITKSSYSKGPANSDPDKQRRMAEREGRRIRRRRNRENLLQPGQKHYEGLSSDDEEERSVVANFNSSMQTILRDSELIFSDVNDNFSSLNEIGIWIEKWKINYAVTYSEAYITLCLPKLFGPFIRLELLSWNPLEQVRNIETMHWYRLLLTYGCIDNGQFDDADTDNDLLPMIVEKVVVPKLTELVKRVWDPLSGTQTSRLVTLISRLCDDYPTLTDTSTSTKNLLKAIVNRIKKTLEDDVFVPLYPRQLLESRMFNGLPFFQRQLWSCVKLLKNILKWDGVLAEQPLLELSVNGLLNRYMILGLQNSPVNMECLEKAKMISASFPKSWFDSLYETCRPIPQLSMFCRFLKLTAEYVGNEKTSISTDISNTREYLKDVMKILISIGEREQAQIISKQFSIF